MRTDTGDKEKGGPYVSPIQEGRAQGHPGAESDPPRKLKMRQATVCP
jgi:hypothetical protein